MSARTQYARPRSVAQASQLLAQVTSGAMIIAGGQDLMPHLNHARVTPALLVDVSGLDELRAIEVDGECLSLGGLVVHRELQSDALVARHAPLLAAAARAIGGGWQVHNRATLGGNLASQHPLYDLMPALLALDAEVELHDADGVRRVPLALLARRAPGLGTRTLLTRVRVPLSAPATAWAYRKLEITDGSYASANAAVTLHVDARQRLAACRLVVGAVSQQPLDVSHVVHTLLDQPLARVANFAIEDTVRVAVTEPLDDQRGHADYRRAMAGVMAARALRAALTMAMTRAAGVENADE